MTPAFCVDLPVGWSFTVLVLIMLLLSCSCALLHQYKAPVVVAKFLLTISLGKNCVFAAWTNFSSPFVFPPVFLPGGLQLCVVSQYHRHTAAASECQASQLCVHCSMRCFEAHFHCMPANLTPLQSVSKECLGGTTGGSSSSSSAAHF